jgi:hypothetical protein
LLHRNSPEKITEAAIVSSRRSSSSLEENLTAVHIFETAVVICTSSTTPSPSPLAETPPSSSTRAVLVGVLHTGELHSLYFFSCPRICIARHGLDHLTQISTDQ